jgi:hypothetical protein
MTIVIIAAVVLYLLLHHRSYRRHRRAGLSVGLSLMGPFHTVIRISRWFRL